MIDEFFISVTSVPVLKRVKQFLTRNKKPRLRVVEGGGGGAATFSKTRANPVCALIERLTGSMPIVLNRAKVALAVLCGIVLPLVGLLSSIVILSDGRERA